MKKSVRELEEIASQVRRDIIRMTTASASGHPGGSMSSTDILVSLFFNQMDIEPANFTIDGKGEDVFYLSIGHISPLFYSVLARRGYFPVDELKTFRLFGSRLQGHPCVESGLPGVRIASGSLGQGLAVAAGHALAKKLDGDKKVVYALMGDGELEEGEIWESSMFAAAHKIDNLIAFVDWNRQQIDGSCESVLPGASSNLPEKFKAFGWDVLELDGHSIEQIISTIEKAKSMLDNGKPIMILAHTIMGKGVDFMSDTNEYHGKTLSAEQQEIALAQLKETLGDF